MSRLAVRALCIAISGLVLSWFLGGQIAAFHLAGWPASCHERRVSYQPAHRALRACWCSGHATAI